jgi:hypothetical protein
VLPQEAWDLGGAEEVKEALEEMRKLLEAGEKFW